jgi:hypothetical protein
MSYGVEVAGETTLVGWDERGEIEPWCEIEAEVVLRRLQAEFRALGVAPAMRVVEIKRAEGEDLGVTRS